ncbi:YajG family lipoprotein [bacterium]|nr:YajG family lipoprotein [bacterium]
MTKISLFLLFFTISTPIFAQESNLVLSLPQNFANNVCPVKVWKDIPVVLKVKDNRESAFVGEIAKGSEEIDVFVNPPLELQFQKALEGLLTVCGLQVMTTSAEATVLKITIEKFYAGGKKKFLTEKHEAESALMIMAEKGGNKIFDVDLGFSIESKGIRKKNIKQLTKTLSDLFYETLKQIPVNRYLKDL